MEYVRTTELLMLLIKRLHKKNKKNMNIVYEGKDLTQEKKDMLSDLIYSGEENPLIDSEQMLGLFRKYAKEVDEYKYFSSGYENLISKFSEEISTNGEFKAFLTGYVDPENTITVFMAITGSLSL